MHSLCTFAELKKWTISFVMSVFLSVRTEYLGSHCKNNNEIWYLKIFRKYFEKKIDFDQNLTNIVGTLREYICKFITIYCRILRRTKNVSDKISWKNQNTFDIKNIFRKSCLLWDNNEKYGRARQTTDHISDTSWIMSVSQWLIWWQTKPWCVVLMMLLCWSVHFDTCPCSCRQLFGRNDIERCA